MAQKTLEVCQLAGEPLRAGPWRLASRASGTRWIHQLSLVVADQTYSSTSLLYQDWLGTLKSLGHLLERYRQDLPVERMLGKLASAFLVEVVMSAS